MWVKWLAEGHIHFPYALTNHRRDVCVEENDLTTKQQTEDQANSKPRCEEIFFSMHKVQSFLRRECEVVQKCNVMTACLLAFPAYPAWTTLAGVHRKPMTRHNSSPQDKNAFST